MLRRNELVSEVQKVLHWKREVESYQGNGPVSDHDLAVTIVDAILTMQGRSNGGMSIDHWNETEKR